MENEKTFTFDQLTDDAKDYAIQVYFDEGGGEQFDERKYSEINDLKYIGTPHNYGSIESIPDHTILETGHMITSIELRMCAGYVDESVQDLQFCGEFFYKLDGTPYIVRLDPDFQDDFDDITAHTYTERLVTYPVSGKTTEIEAGEQLTGADAEKVIAAFKVDMDKLIEETEKEAKEIAEAWDDPENVRNAYRENNEKFLEDGTPINSMKYRNEQREKAEASG